MNEKPILFSGPMVRAILDGTKTQTRRVVEPQPEAVEELHVGGDVYWPCNMTPEGAIAMHCPYGNAGSLLWVRETFAMGEGVIYREEWERDCPSVPLNGHWKPSIFMPRNLSRITLKIKSVRIERLKDISERDAEAEGVDESGTKCMVCGDPYSCAVDGFICLWESINGAGSWDQNPWVWVVEFEMVEGTK